LKKFRKKTEDKNFKRQKRFYVHLAFGRHFEFSCLATLILFYYHKMSIRIKTNFFARYCKFHFSWSQSFCKKKIHLDLSAILNFYKKNLFHKIYIFSQIIQQKKKFWRTIIFKVFNWKKRFRRHLEFSRHFEFLGLALFFLFFSSSKSLRKYINVFFKV
jgi:uncharacterized protein YbcC (UPF0753/DUF2309 family)